MRRLATRLIIMAIVLGGSWLSYQAADVTKCSGPKAEAWAESTLRRREAASKDYDSITLYTTYSQYALLEGRAEERYRSQVAQETPGCLNELQDLSVQFLYAEWKAYDAASDSNFELAAQYDDESIKALEAMEREFDRLAAKYRWELD